MAVLTVACACGRIAFDERPDGTAGDDAPLGMFGMPSDVAELDTSFDEDDPTLTADMLEIYFDSGRPGLGNEDIYRAVRRSVSDPWDPPQLVTELSTPNADLSPGISGDGLTMYLATNAGGGNGLDIHVSTRPDRESAWSTPVRVVELSSPDEDTNAQPTGDGLELWFCSRRGGATDRQLYLATRSNMNAPWSSPVAVTAVNVDLSTYTCDPWASDDRRWLYFASNRPGGEGGVDIWRVERPTPETFGVAEPVAEVDTASAEHDPWLSPDQRTMFFMHRSGGSSAIASASR